MTAFTAPGRDRINAPRWMRNALIASLAVHLLVAGALASAFWRFRQEAPFAGSPGNVNLLGFTASLPAERRQAILQQTAEERRALRPLRAEVRAARLAARSTFLTEPFDRDAFAKAQTLVLETELRARKQSQALFISIAGMLSTEERQAFARWQPGGPPPGRGFGGSQPHNPQPGEISPARVPGGSNTAVNPR